MSGPRAQQEGDCITSVASEKNLFLATLVSAHGASLERYLARTLDSHEDAAEVAQEAFLRLHRLDAPETLDNARAFLFQVATNLAVDQLRRRKLHLQFLNGERNQAADGDPRDPNASTASPEHILGAREKLSIVFNAVDELPPNVRQAFLLHRRNGMPYSAIAESMQVSVSSVEKYILQALLHCRKRLASFYPPGEDD